MPLSDARMRIGAVATNADFDALAPPDGATAIHHIPPSAWPETSPGFLSLLNVYSGAPSKVSCLSPCARTATPKSPVIPGILDGAGTPDGMSIGGQNAAH